MILDPAIYRGTLRHRRFKPSAHHFTYSLFMVFLDIDTIPQTMSAARFAGYNRFNWASFHQRDHFGDPAVSLRERLQRAAKEEGIAFPDGPVYLLTNLRYLGYCFNPISMYYCYSRSGGPPLVVAEVSNTFGESKNYWLGPHNAVALANNANSLRFRCPKTFHVSPFMGMNLEYDFLLTEPSGIPDSRMVVHMNTQEEGNAEGSAFFDATLTLNRQAWTSANLTRALLRQPMLTGKVIAAIHWEELRLWAGGAPLYPHPEGARK